MQHETFGGKRIISSNYAIFLLAEADSQKTHFGASIAHPTIENCGDFGCSNGRQDHQKMP